MSRRILKSLLCATIFVQMLVILKIFDFSHFPFQLRVENPPSIFRWFHAPLAAKKYTPGSTSAVAGGSSKHFNQVQHLLTLFTTFLYSHEKQDIHRKVVHNWKTLGPDVRRIYFTVRQQRNDSFEKELGKEGWEVVELEKESPTGLPILKEMFLTAMKKFRSHYYCFANGDILFTNDLLETLRMLKGFEKIPYHLLVGQRKNYNTSRTQISRIDQGAIKGIAKKQTFFNDNAEDYFITPADGIRWKDVPEFVVGRVGYDNWLVATVLMSGGVVVDVSHSVTALHLTGDDGNYAGRAAAHGVNYNNELIGDPGFPVGLGHTSCGQLYTLRVQGEVRLRHRTNNKCEVGFKKKSVDPYRYQAIRLDL